VNFVMMMIEWYHWVAFFYSFPFVFSKAVDLYRGGPHRYPLKPPRLEDENTPKRISLTKEELQCRPMYAWPTIALGAVTLAAWVSIVALYSIDRLSIPFTIIANAVLAYISFTPQHDATHGSVSSPSAKTDLNLVVGYLCGLPLLLPFHFMKLMHSQHHRYNNDARYDPDYWCAHVSRDYFRGSVEIFLKSMMALPYYIHLFMALVRHEWEHNKDGKLSVRVQKALDDMLLFAGAFGLAAFALREKFLISVVAPALIALTYLMITFDYWPHRAHEYSAREQPYKATNFTRGILSVDEPSWVHAILGIIMLNQDIHLIHHLWPHIPFYKMPQIYKNHKDELVEKGARMIPILDFKGIQYERNEKEQSKAD